MPFIVPPPAAAVLVLIAAGPSVSRQADFDYCAPPVVPACIEQTARSGNRKTLDLCSRQVLHFTQTLGAYRACLTRESERAVERGNDAVAKFRCLSLGHKLCAPVRDETEQ